MTVVIPESYKEAIKELVQKESDTNEGLYPSRSELVRYAVKEKLQADIKRLEELKKHNTEPEPQLDEKKYVKIPIDADIDDNGKNKPNQEREFKIYKIVRKLL